MQASKHFDRRARVNEPFTSPNGTIRLALDSSESSDIVLLLLPARSLPSSPTRTLRTAAVRVVLLLFRQGRRETELGSLLPGGAMCEGATYRSSRGASRAQAQSCRRLLPRYEARASGGERVYSPSRNKTVIQCDYSCRFLCMCSGQCRLTSMHMKPSLK